MKLTVHSRQEGLALIELAIVVAVLGVMAMIALPNLFSARKTAEEKVCIANLNSIKHAKEKWGFDEKKGDDEIPSYSDIKPYLSKTQTQNICPIGGKYTLGSLSENPSCEYVNLGHTLSSEE
jgi:prepilin-type N-terminal cleavage/methylation domain-containing protein